MSVHYLAPPPVPAAGFAAEDRVRCTKTGKTGSVFVVRNSGIVVIDLDPAPGAPHGQRVVRSPSGLERIPVARDPAVLVRLPGNRTLRRQPATGAAEWTRDRVSGDGCQLTGDGCRVSGEGAP